MGFAVPLLQRCSRFASYLLCYISIVRAKNVKECSSTRKIRAHYNPARKYLPATFLPYRATPLPAHHSSSCAYPLRPRIPTPLTALNPLLTTNPLSTNKRAHQQDPPPHTLDKVVRIYHTDLRLPAPVLNPNRILVRHSRVARPVR